MLSNHGMKASTCHIYRYLLAVVVMLGEGLTFLPSALAQAASGPISNTATASYASPNAPNTPIRAVSETVQLGGNGASGAFITGCVGEPLGSYQGFSVGLFDVDGSGLEPAQVTALTGTEFPDIPGNSIPAGVSPNGRNVNPYALTSDGQYNFLLDDSRGQLQVGRSYILVVSAPPGSEYATRRFKIVITERTGNLIAYRATALDGQPITLANGAIAQPGTLTITDSGVAGLVSAVFSLAVNVCNADDLQIIKSGDRSNAQIGDIVVYRLSIRNLSSATVNQLTVTDTLPLGFQFLDNSVRAELAGAAVPVTATRNGSTITFRVSASLPSNRSNSNAVLNIAYAARLTPDAIRGSGLNSAIVNGQRADNLRAIKDGPAVHRVRVRSGLLSDCGTIIGRVFVDKNFDGEQQPNEPGVPNAVVFLDDGNRITTDPNGLFSVANVLAGHRTGVLDLTSLPGYTLAPNLYFSERNSQSRLVNLAPGGLVRMNFAVTPAFREVQSK